MPLRFSNLYRLTDPAVEPVTVAEAKAQLKLLHSDDDEDLSFMIQVAREWAEDHVSRALIYQHWVAQFSEWPEPIYDKTFVLPRPSLSVVLDLRYWDADDELVELSEQTDYFVDEISGTVRMVDTFSWPTLSKNRVNPIEVEFRAGMGDSADDIPLRYKQAIRLCVASMYGADRFNPRTKVSFRAPSVAEALLANLRVRPV